MLGPLHYNKALALGDGTKWWSLKKHCLKIGVWFGVPQPPPILYFIVYITVCRGWGGVVVMYTIENQHLHLGGGASENEEDLRVGYSRGMI